MYKTPEALQMAVRDAARNSPIETSRAIESFYYHRLLCRIFSRPDSKFVLKGGLGMLARTTDARATRDIDLATEELGIEKAVEELKELASIDLGDFIVFHFDGMEPIRVEDEYRDGFRVPGAWHESYSGRYAALAKRTGMDASLQILDAAEALVAKCLNPVLSKTDGKARWDHEKLAWVGRS